MAERQGRHRPVFGRLVLADWEESAMPEPVSSYEPREFWNEKARASQGDVLAAVCHADASDNRNIDAVQRRLVTRAIARATREAPLGGRKVLDYGCGSGRWAPVLRRFGGMYYGVDIAEEMIALAAARDPLGGEYRVLEEDGRIPHADGEFSLVCSIAVLHHNRRSEQERILAEIRRVLRPDGHLVVFESVEPPNPENPVLFPRRRSDWQTLARGFGLEPIWYEGCRYFLVRSAVRRIVKPLRVGAPAASHRAVERLGLVLDPLAGPILPARMHTRAAMTFRRALHR